jgi:hypothetical protein
MEKLAEFVKARFLEADAKIPDLVEMVYGMLKVNGTVNISKKEFKDAYLNDTKILVIYKGETFRERARETCQDFGIVSYPYLGFLLMRERARRIITDKDKKWLVSECYAKLAGDYTIDRKEVSFKQFYDAYNENKTIPTSTGNESAVELCEMLGLITA